MTNSNYKIYFAISNDIGLLHCGNFDLVISQSICFLELFIFSGLIFILNCFIISFLARLIFNCPFYPILPSASLYPSSFLLVFNSRNMVESRGVDYSVSGAVIGAFNLTRYFLRQWQRWIYHRMFMKIIFHSVRHNNLGSLFFAQKPQLTHQNIRILQWVEYDLLIEIVLQILTEHKTWSSLK